MACYRGEQYDPDLGLYYLRARYYNPATGRFLSVDPLADEGQRRYEYAAANPVDGMDPNGSEAYIETHLLPYYFPPVWIPNWCGLSGTNPMGGGLPCKPPPDHWTVKVGWRPLYGLSSLTPGHHPLGHWHHTYISIYNPDPTWGTQTWGVLGENNTSKNQEVLRGDTRNNDVGGDENKISCTDSEARTLWDALMETDWTDSHRVCPSCGTANYKNITNMHHPLPFEFFNSNTYTFNMISNWGKTPPPEQNSPGYHLDPRYAGYF
jgi:RHS repeat-associated protein